MSRRALSACLALLILAGIAAADPDETLLLREPSISATQVVFRYAEDLWIVSREGGTASRLTSHAGDESSPHFSPDGTLIAFSAEYDGNTDIYVVAAEGGQPQRLTYHPDGDFVRGWAPDGKRVLLTSYRDTPHWYGRFYTVAIDGTPPTRLIVPRGEMVSYSPDGGRIAYTQLRGAHYTWRRYRGGRTPSIWIFDLESHDAEEIPDVNANDTIPMWIGDTIYFVSDRNRTMNLFAYDPGTSEIDQLTFHDDFDIRSASANRQDIVYEQGGRIHVFDTETRQGRAISVRVVSDLPHLRARYRDVSDSIRSWSLSPSGARAVFGARGEVFTVPAKKGDIRNITRTPAVHERYPSWSPDGNQIAYFSDATGEYQLMLRDQKGVDEPRAIALGEPSFFFSPRWSPDGAKIAYTDKHLRLYILDVESGESSLVDTEPYARYGSDAQYSFDPEWSPDSRWLAYVRRQLPTHDLCLRRRRGNTPSDHGRA